MLVFVANAANLMTAIKNMLAASRLAHAIPNNIITPKATEQNQPAATTPQPQPPKPLCKDNMKAVCQCLYPLRARWKTIGTFLCVEHSSLEAVRADNETADDRLLAMVAVWLRQTTPPPTWQALADAVQYIDSSS